MVLENCLYGSLSQLALFTKCFDDASAYVVIQQIANTLNLIHRRNILHLDIKANNVLINFNKNNQFLPECGMLPIEFKLADFGIAKNLTNYPKNET